MDTDGRTLSGTRGARTETWKLLVLFRGYEIISLLGNLSLKLGTMSIGGIKNVKTGKNRIFSK